MPLGQGILDVIEAIPDRVEVSGESPTWQVTAGSWESALGYARESFGEVAVLGRRDHGRWWRRVTLTVTVEPRLAATAPPLESLREGPNRSPRRGAPGDRDRTERENGDRTPSVPRSRPVPSQGRQEPEDAYPRSLEAIFARQEAARMDRLRVPGQPRPD